MTGDDRVRFCSLCSLNVYNFAEMTQDEIGELLLRSEGRRVCGRLYRRADGTMLTRDCPTGPLRKRASRVASATFAAMVSFASFAFGGTTCEMKKHGKVDIQIERSVAPQKAVFTGFVLLGGNPLPGATVTVRNEVGTTVERTDTTDANGAFNIDSFDDGLYQVDVTLEGIIPSRIEHLQLTANEVTKAQFAMRIDAQQEMGIIAVDETPRHEPLSTTFTQDFINKLPL